MEEEDVEVKKDVEEEDEEEEEEDDDEEEVEGVEVDGEEDVEVEDMEEEDEEELEEDEKETEDEDVEELEDTHGTGKAPQPDGDGEPGTSPPPDTGCMPGSSPPVPGQLCGTEASLRALVSQLRAKLGQREAAWRALAARLAREERRHRRREEASARQARLRAREAEALRETNAFLGRALAAAGGPGVLEQAQEAARGWQEVAEERGARLAGALAEAAALASRLRDCQAALAAAGRTDTLEDAGAPDEVAAVEEVLRRALELACGPQEPLPDPQGDGEPSTAASMAMVWASPRGPRGGGEVGTGTGLSPCSPTAPGHPGHHGTGGGPAELAAAPGPAAGGGTAAGAAQQVGHGPLLPPHHTPQWVPPISTRHKISYPHDAPLGPRGAAPGHGQGEGGKDLGRKSWREASIWGLMGWWRHRWAEVWKNEFGASRSMERWEGVNFGWRDGWVDGRMNLG